MKDSWIGQVGIWGCGYPVETSAEGRSTDRAGRRDQMHYQYLKENKPTVVNVMRMNGNLKSYLREIDDQAEEMLFHLVKQMAKNEGVDEAMNELHSLAEVEAFSYGFRMGEQLMIEAGVPFVK